MSLSSLLSINIHSLYNFKGASNSICVCKNIYCFCIKIFSFTNMRWRANQTTNMQTVIFWQSQAELDLCEVSLYKGKMICNKTEEDPFPCLLWASLIPSKWVMCLPSFPSLHFTLPSHFFHPSLRGRALWEYHCGSLNSHNHHSHSSCLTLSFHCHGLRLCKGPWIGPMWRPLRTSSLPRIETVLHDRIHASMFLGKPKTF